MMRRRTYTKRTAIERATLAIAAAIHNFRASLAAARRIRARKRIRIVYVGR